MSKLTIRGRIWMLLAVAIIPVLALGVINYFSLNSMASLMETGDSTNGIIKGILLIRNHEKNFVEHMAAEEADKVRQTIKTVEGQVTQANSGGHVQALERLKNQLAAYAGVFNEMADKTLELRKQIENQRDLSVNTMQLLQKNIIDAVEKEQGMTGYTGIEVELNKITLLGIARNFSRLSERLQLNVGYLMLFKNLEAFHTQMKVIEKECKFNLINFAPLIRVMKDQNMVKLKDKVPAQMKAQLKAAALIGTLWEQTEQLRNQLEAHAQSLVDEEEKFLATS